MSTSPCWLACLLLCLLQTGCTRDPIGEQVTRLSNSDVEVRRTTARSLRERPIADDRIVAALARNVADGDADVRCLSIEALAKLGPSDKSVVAHLKPALTDSEKRVRLEAALAIAKVDPRDISARPMLTSAMREGDGRTLLAIGTMGSDATWTVPTLVGLLSHAAPQVRALAARTLGQIGPSASEAKPSLDAAIRDPNAAVQKAAKDALSRIEAHVPNGKIAK